MDTNSNERPALVVPGDSAIADLTRSMSQMNEEAFTRFHELYYPRLLRYLIVLTRGDMELSRDLLQIVLTRVVRSIRPFETERALWNWLAAVARNGFIDNLRKLKRTPTIVPLFDHESPPAELGPTSGADLDAALETALDRCLSCLPPDEQALVTAAYLERQCQQSIAQQLGSTRKAVESKLARIRTKLRAALLHHLKHDHEILRQR